MQTPYEAIKALPGKGTDWQGLVTDLEARYREVYIAARGQEPVAGAVDYWGPVGSVRAMRSRAMSAGSWAVREASTVSRFIPPSPETMEWGGFLGGEHISYQDENREEAETAIILAIISKYAKNGA